MKSAKQHFEPTPQLLQMMETFRMMVNDCIRIGLKYDVSARVKLTKLCYHQLTRYNIYSVYKLCAIYHAAGIIANRKKSIKRGFKPRQPYAKRPLLIAYTGFKIAHGMLKVPLGNIQYFDIPLNMFVNRVISVTSLRIPSFTLTNNSLSICYSKEVVEVEYTDIEGVDRNLRNLTVGNLESVMQYDLSKAVDISENTISIMSSFKRNDVRIRKKL